MALSTPPTQAAAALADARDDQLIAVMEVMYFIAKADGFLAANELRQFLKFAKTITAGRISSGQLSELVSGWGKREPMHLPERLAALTLVLGDDSIRRAAYDLAANMATADGELHEKELAVLETIGAGLGIV